MNVFSAASRAVGDAGTSFVASAPVAPATKPQSFFTSDVFIPATSSNLIWEPDPEMAKELYSAHALAMYRSGEAVQIDAPPVLAPESYPHWELVDEETHTLAAEKLELFVIEGELVIKQSLLNIDVLPLWYSAGPAPQF
jgi:hypothetical protein